jgi:hypothetical protein
MKDKFMCSVCGIINEFVRFEGEQDAFICDKCLYEIKNNNYKGVKE